MTNKKNSPPIRISEAILRVAEPLIRKYPKRERISAAIELAMFSWNASLITEIDREEIEKNLIESMPGKLNATEIAATMQQTDILIKRKKELYPEVDYLIVNHSLSFEDSGRITLNVNTIAQ
ncbi:hypothetical protein G3480_11980 [Thiorhodococcus mannitoliphagus]|uniref:Uncharacterized protein n=1 Tax=Thiorhodococcus mannitoliphagus TaxID=329406 RepID=A0A6P1DY08_9GAMM|nr:hypothetical protein [Thiorhodococcus mannitoliphagus]NEX21022.1 hypothetical protein [Thiorhodococcus mannitoliphagus]